MASSVSVIATTSNHPHPSHQHHMDRLDAARALLGVSPSSSHDHDPTSDGSSNTSRLCTASVSFTKTKSPQVIPTSSNTNNSSSNKVSSPPSATEQSQEEEETPCDPTQETTTTTNTTAKRSNRTVSFEQPPTAPATGTQQQQPQEPPQRFELAPPTVFTSTGLDALAALASTEQASWESQGSPKQQHQQHQSSLMNLSALVAVSASSAATASLSSSDDEEDSEAMPPPPPRAGGRRRSVSNPEGMEKWARPSLSNRRDFVLPASILEEELAEANAAMEAHERQHQKQKQQKRHKGQSSLGPIDEDEESSQQQLDDEQQQQQQLTPISGLMSEEEQANLTPEELLKRARSRLLEDLSEGSLNGEKGVLTLPHSLSKYKEVYNKNGRIGIYTPAERAAIIARFNGKRARRVWNKKIRYNCRKNLADRRMRVKGRFVKRSTEQQARAVVDTTDDTPASASTEDPSEAGDEDMPDVTDPEAGFCPTEDQPYRRTRRHTIT